jgi:flavin reductase (NADH)
MTDSIYATRSIETATTDGFRAMMRGFPTGVAIVTAANLTGQPLGMTCSSVCSVTLQPPTLLVCLRATSPTLAAIQVRGTFAVNLLHDNAQSTAELFASGNPARFDQIRWHYNHHSAGPHLHDDTLAIADCHLTDTHLVGDHVVVYGQVLNVNLRSGYRPLLYGLRRYGSWPEP